MGPHFKTLSKQSSGKYITSEFLLSLFRHWYSAKNDSKWLSFKKPSMQWNFINKIKTKSIPIWRKANMVSQVVFNEIDSFFSWIWMNLLLRCVWFQKYWCICVFIFFQWISFCVCVCVENMFTHYSNCGLMKKAPVPLSHPCKALKQTNIDLIR